MRDVLKCDPFANGAKVARAQGEIELIDEMLSEVFMEKIKEKLEEQWKKTLN